MRRRRAEGPVISLFAFQDIITSVTGILLLVTLMLALELIEHDGRSAASVADDAADRLRQLTAALSAERDALRARAAAPVSTSALTEAELGRRVAYAKEEVDAAAKKNQTLTQKRDDANRKREASEAALFDLRDALAEAERLDAETEELRKEAKKPKGLVGRVPPQGGWLIDVSGTRITAAPLKIKATPPSFPVASGDPDPERPDETTRRFARWSSEPDVAGSYLLLVVRPSGIHRFQHIEGLFSTKGRAFGFEPVGEDEAVTPPE